MRLGEPVKAGLPPDTSLVLPGAVASQDVTEVVRWHFLFVEHTQNFTLQNLYTYGIFISEDKFFT